MSLSVFTNLYVPSLFCMTDTVSSLMVVPSAVVTVRTAYVEPSCTTVFVVAIFRVSSASVTVTVPV